MNISDIAKLAGVSPATVSRYLNNGYVSQEKRKIISKVIEETGYSPLVAAQNLKTQKVKTIGVIVPKLTSESVGHMVDGISKRFEGLGYEVLLANTNNNTDKEIEYLNYFKTNQVDGIIFMATKFEERHQKIIDHYNKPVIIASQNIENLPSVFNDDLGAAYSATKHLIEQGSKNIVYLGVLEEDIAAGLNRFKGFKKALDEAGLKIAAKKIIDFSAYDGYQGIDEVVESNVDFDGVFCATDSIAAGVVNNLLLAKKKIPEDVKVIGIGDSTISKAIIPSISTVHLYYDELGYEAADMIINILEGNAKSVRQLKLGYELCVRESTE